MLVSMDSAIALGFRSGAGAGASCPRLAPPPSTAASPPQPRSPHYRRRTLSAPNCTSAPAPRRRFLGGAAPSGTGASCPRLAPPPSTAASPPQPRSPHYRRRTLSAPNCTSAPAPRRRFLGGAAPIPDLHSNRGWLYRLRSSREQSYHPSEEIGDPVAAEGEDARLSDAEIARTLIEVNSKAAVMFSGLIDDEVHENIIWPDLPYLTDEHGDIYFAVKDDEDVLKTLITDDKMVQVIIGLDNIEMLMEMGVDGPSNFDFGAEDMSSDEDSDEDSDEESDTDDDYDELQDAIAILDDEDDDMISSETLSEWADSDTLNSSHPMYFARKIAEVVSNFHMDWMEQPSASIIIQGLLRPAFVEDQPFVREYQSGGNTINNVKHNPGKVLEDKTEDPDKDHTVSPHAVFYKLETINIQLVSSYGNQNVVKIQDFRKARADVIAHSAVNIISRLKAGGEVTIQALKSLCWRHKTIQVEEAALSGVDSLGFDLRVCSGTQVQTLRFAFNTRATSELSAEKQLRDLLFPRSQHKQQERQQAQHPKEPLS